MSIFQSLILSNYANKNNLLAEKPVIIFMVKIETCKYSSGTPENSYCLSKTKTIVAWEWCNTPWGFFLKSLQSIFNSWFTEFITPFPNGGWSINSLVFYGQLSWQKVNNFRYLWTCSKSSIATLKKVWIIFIKTPEQRQWHVSHLFSGVSIVVSKFF